MSSAGWISFRSMGQTSGSSVTFSKMLRVRTVTVWTSRSRPGIVQIDFPTYLTIWKTLTLVPKIRQRYLLFSLVAQDRKWLVSRSRHIFLLALSALLCPRNLQPIVLAPSECLMNTRLSAAPQNESLRYMLTPSSLTQPVTVSQHTPAIIPYRTVSPLRSGLYQALMP